MDTHHTVTRLDRALANVVAFDSQGIARPAWLLSEPLEDGSAALLVAWSDEFPAPAHLHPETPESTRLAYTTRLDWCTFGHAVGVLGWCHRHEWHDAGSPARVK